METMNSEKNLNEIESVLRTAGAIAFAIVVTVPIALTIYDKGLKPLLEKKPKEDFLPDKNCTT